MNLTIRTSTSNEVATLHLEGSVGSIIEAVELREKISEAGNEGALFLVLDCTGLTFINSVGLGMIVAGYTTFKNRGGELCIAGVNEDIREILAKTMLTEVIRVFDAVEEAVTTISQKKSDT